MNDLPDPSWKNGPPEPRHRHSEHAVTEPVLDLDGVGVDEAERLTTESDGEPLVAVQSMVGCRREFCDEQSRTRYVYSTADLSRRVVQACQFASEYWREYASINATIVDYDDAPIVGIEFPSLFDNHVETTLGYVSPALTLDEDFHGPCHGREEPEPDVNAHRYDEL